MQKKIKAIVSRITMQLMGIAFRMLVERDKKLKNGRFYLQVEYTAPCNKTGEFKTWRGRKWYLSKYMTNDEIIKTAYYAFEACVKHEIMEGFKVDNIILFNPHVNFEELLKISHNEIKRD